MLIFVALVVALFMNNPLGDGQTIKYSQLLTLSEQKNIKQFTFVGKDRGVGAVKDPQTELAKSLNLPADGKFQVSLPPPDNRLPLDQLLRTQNPDVQIASVEEHG